MDNESLSFPIDRNSLLDDIENPCEINSKELIPIESETLISTTTMDLSTASLVSSVDLPSFSATLDYQSGPGLPTYLHQNELSGINSAYLLETIVEPSVVISEPPPPLPPPPQRKRISQYSDLPSMLDSI